MGARNSNAGPYLFVSQALYQPSHPISFILFLLLLLLLALPADEQMNISGERCGGSTHQRERQSNFVGSRNNMGYWLPKEPDSQTGLPGAFGEELSVTGVVRLQDKDPPGSSIALSGV